MREKTKFVLTSFIFLSLLCLSFGSSALNANFTNITGGIERAFGAIDSTNLVNFSVGAMSEGISKVQFIITGSTCMDRDKVIPNSNGTTSSTTLFVNSSNSACLGGWDSYNLILTYTNVTGAAIIPNGSVKNFWFNINSKSAAASMFTILVNATGNATGASNLSNGGTAYSWSFTFRFSGYVKNESGGWQNATNVSLYEFSEGMSGPIESLVAQTQTGSVGNFTLAGINADGSKKYKLKMIYYNPSNPSQALKVGPNLPAFPAEMFYAKVYGFGEDRPSFEFMRPPSFNGTTLYLEPAAMINISATNGSTLQRFGYMLMEQGTGFPLESNGNGNVTSTQIVVPINRWYTVMAMRANSIFSNTVICNGTFMNDTLCMTPPKSNATIYPTTGGQMINVSIDLSIVRRNMYGCIISSGNSTPITNVSIILPKMMPWNGFIPPARADVQDLNLSNRNQLNYSDWRCPGKIAWYNISVLNSNYFLEFYGRNSTPYRGGEFVAALQNASFTSSDQNINITLLPLAGTFSTATAGELIQGTGTNTTKFTIRVQNSSGSAITSDKPHIEVTLKNSATFGQVTYVADPTNGSFSLVIPFGTTGKVKVFSNNAPPKEKVLNLSYSELNITLTNLQGGDGGFRRRNSSGQLDVMNITEDSFNIAMNFFRAGGICDSLNPDSNCNLTSVGAKNFNPFVALVAGKINMRISLSSGVGITFYNFDMFSAKQPPMESIMNNNAVKGDSSGNQLWEFGSFVPSDVYDYAIVSIPYSDSALDDSANVNISIPVLYDENWNAAWNVSAGDSPSNLSSTIDDYLGDSNNRSFNSSGYRPLLQSGGLICNNTNSSIIGSNPAVYCYIDTSANVLYLRVPHFSGIAPNIVGSTPSSATVSTTTTSSGGGSSSTTTYENLAVGVTKTFSQGDALSFKIGTAPHMFLLLYTTTNKSVTIQLSSKIQIVTLAVGEKRQFDLDADGKMDIEVTINSISGITANITIKTATTVSTTPAAETPVTTPATGNQTLESTETPVVSKMSTTTKVLIGVGIVLIILVVAWIIVRFNKKGLEERVLAGKKLR